MSNIGFSVTSSGGVLLDAGLCGVCYSGTEETA